MLFSATMTEQIDELVKLSLNKPVRLEADPSLKRPATLTEEYASIPKYSYVYVCPKSNFFIFANNAISLNIINFKYKYIL